MKVEFTDPAEESLRKIYCRYPENIANRIVEELRPLNQGHRFILEGNYKIIYLQ
ncbi:MAG: hypothetical protein ACMVP2_12975 [Imperialibacter sp.]|uniref:hypothetical protein n=1 Tax=Imperialibacter sp. TaxID=2038411 RepID=UPI003A8B2EAE